MDEVKEDDGSMEDPPPAGRWAVQISVNGASTSIRAIRTFLFCLEDNFEAIDFQITVNIIVCM